MSKVFSLLFLISTAFLTFVSVSKASEQACDEIAVSIATTPVSSQTPSGVKSALDKVSKIPDSADIALIGDSLIERWAESRDVTFGGTSTWNYGVGGDRTQNVLWRLEQSRVKGVSPKYSVILVGTNNFFDGGAVACSVMAGISSIVLKVEELWPDTKIVIVTIPPRGRDFRNADAERVRLNDELVEKLGAQSNVAIAKLDDNEMTCGIYSNPSAVPKCVDSNVSICSKYKPDNLHLNSEGYNILLSAIRKAVREKFHTEI